MWWWVVLFSLIGGIGAVIGAALISYLPARTRTRLTPILISYATGTLLGAAFLGMIPAALKAEDPKSVSATVLGGIVLCFVLEKLTIWRTDTTRYVKSMDRPAP